MSGAALEYSFNDLIANMEGLAEALANPTPLLQRIGAALVTSSQMRFETQKAPDGAPWAALAARTINDRIRRGYGAVNKLRRTGDMYRSINYRVNPGLLIISMGSVGSSKDYGRAQQMGAVINRQRRGKSRASVGGFQIVIPARPVLGISSEDETMIQDEFESFVKEQGVS